MFSANQIDRIELILSRPEKKKHNLKVIKQKYYRNLLGSLCTFGISLYSFFNY